MIEKIRKYFIDNDIIDDDYRINVDFLGEEPTEFSIMTIPVEPIIEQYVDGSSLRQFQFQLMSCNEYGSDVLQNISNSSFYENLYKKIETYNKARTLPEIDGITKIECINNGAILNALTNTARYSIQMKIEYYKKA